MTERRNLKLELTWVGKDNRRPLLEPRILLPDPDKSYAARRSDTDIFDNQLIFGDNLLALQSLATDPNVCGKVKCIFIDPPYNTGSAFEHYDDGMEHSLWLGMMRERLELLRELLSDDGSIWISIDDNEAHYLKVLCDEIFGRSNFVADVIWQKRTSPDMRSTLGAGHEHILVFSSEYEKFRRSLNKLPRSSDQEAQYKNPDNDPRGSWVSSDYTAQGFRPNQMYKITTPGGVDYYPPEGVCWKNVEEVFLELVSDNRIWFGTDGRAMPRRKTFLSESEGVNAWTWWTNKEVGHTQEAKRESVMLFGAANAFSTPKPERLLQRIIHLATNPGDLVLDSFAGSGTTGAVAHKMGRRWIMVELGEHAHTHIIPRLHKVIDGTDQGGISGAVGWQGGGGFRYSRLAPSLLKQDKYGQFVINPQYNAEMLAEALCKIHGFTYAPSQNQEFYWMHGRSTESDFIYVTTNYLSYQQLEELSHEVGPERTLLILTSAYDSQGETFDNLTLKKIPQSVLDKCDWDHDDYSLKIENLPQMRVPEEPEPALVRSGAGRRARQQGPGLFDAPIDGVPSGDEG